MTLYDYLVKKYGYETLSDKKIIKKITNNKIGKTYERKKFIKKAVIVFKNLYPLFIDHHNISLAKIFWDIYTKVYVPDIFTIDRNIRLETISKNLDKISIEDLNQIKKDIDKKIKLNKVMVELDEYIPDIFKNKIKCIDTYSTRDNNPDWHYNDGIETSLEIIFESNCSLSAEINYITYYDSGGDLQFEDDEKNLSCSNLNEKTNTRAVILEIENECHEIHYNEDENTIDKKSLKLLDALSIKKTDYNKNMLAILITNMIDQVQPDIGAQIKNSTINKYNDKTHNNDFIMLGENAKIKYKFIEYND
ncbi:DUF5884 domain-containing protein [Megavirus chiliensis]|uniref:Uncharacterized protein n=2 Tax=Megamimivirinae TaxID=3044648 RepID=A0A2L2DNP6_MIMIV|nr:hypothetical protein MegaChil _gp0938 [Megavirus chiliensis]AEQ32688.1 DUF5884 domain-containing protein [Megavirus chiliensis]AVG47774.1 hypothetical protein [Acanthamoeba polyphaga mimivirus]